jgi:hypothetical protein
MTAGEADDRDLDVVRQRLDTVANGARCSLAGQHEVVVRSLLEAFPAAFEGRRRGGDPVAPALIAELLGIDDGTALWDEAHLDKEPDWTTGEQESGQWPAERLDEHRQHPSGSPRP